MNMFGGSGRLTNFPKTRTSFPFPLPTENRFGTDTGKDSRQCHSECSTPVHAHHSEALHTPSDHPQNGSNGKDRHSSGGIAVSPGRLESTFGHTHTESTQAHPSAEHHQAGNTQSTDSAAAQLAQQLSSSSGDGMGKQLDSVLFSQSEIMGLRLMFSLFDRYACFLFYFIFAVCALRLIDVIVYCSRSGSNKIAYEDLVAYAEETGEQLFAYFVHSMYCGQRQQ